MMLGVTQSIRVLRTIPTTISLAKGDSLNTTISNIFRASSFVLAFIFAARGVDIIWIAASGLIGELLAILPSLGMLKYRLNIPVQHFFAPFISSLSGLLLSAFLWHAGLSNSSYPIAVFVASGLSICILALFLLLFSDFRKEIKAIIRPLLPRAGF